MKNIKVLGIDLAKNIFQLHSTDAKGKRVMSKRLSGAKLLTGLVFMQQRLSKPPRNLSSFDQIAHFFGTICDNRR